ncbi:hypothetical protein LJB81_01655 [Desulfovibrio sp. OttesenSCG-928-M14]|nr:hypothetical protein [Desulfovibrio sp. OttesenSCG-928-M14]
MLIRNGKAFTRGLLLMGSFIVVFVLFFMPIFPAQEGGSEKTNGLVFADHLFNTLSKGSSNFFDPTLQDPKSVDAIVEGVKGVNVDIEVPFKDATLAESAVKLLEGYSFEASATGAGVKMKGDLYAFLKGVLADSLSTYNNNFDEVTARRNGMEGSLVMKSYWALVDGMIKPMQRAGQVKEATVVNTVKGKAVESSYNFYGITSLRVVDNIPLVAGFLIFYVIYTMWYGFAIFELFEGIGLTMKKSAKSEV